MTKDDIIRMAREQGLPETANEGIFIVNTDDLGRLLAAEREACAAICRKEAAETDKHLSIVIEALEDCAYFIEKRGKK